MASEFTLIERCFGDRARRGDDVLLGIGDDAALLDVGAAEALVVCIDALAEDVHFPADAPAETVGHKALAVNLSDLAAMGARPAWAQIAVTAPASHTAWLDAFAKGWQLLADAYSVSLVGGDTCRGPLNVAVQVGGWVEPELALRRDRARAGDDVWVSGQPGEAACGLRLWQQGRRTGDDEQRLIERLHRPQPRVELGRALRGIARAAIDVSDGLCADLGHILSRSRVGAHIDVRQLPLSGSLRRCAGPEATDLALNGGDDYELCFTAAPADRPRLEALAVELGIPLARIGAVEAESGLRLRGVEPGSALAARGYQHFTE